MRYKAKISIKEELINKGAILLLTLLFMGSFALVVYLILKDCGGNYEMSNILSHAGNRAVELIFTLFMFAAALFIIFFMLKPAARYFGTIRQVEYLSDGTQKLLFVLDENRKTKAATPTEFPFLVGAECPLKEGDTCIAWIKELSWDIRSVEPLRVTESAAVPDNVRSEARSITGSMNVIFFFIIGFFAVLAIGTVVGLAANFDPENPVMSIVWMAVPVLFFGAAIKYGLKARKMFLKDNAQGAEQAATGYGLEEGVPEIPFTVQIRRKMVTSRNKLSEMYVTNDYQETLYTLKPHRNSFDVVAKDGSQIGTVQLRVGELDTIEVNLTGLQPFTVRKKLNIGVQSANFEIRGLDFTLEGERYNMVLKTLDGAKVGTMLLQKEKKGFLPYWFYRLNISDFQTPNLYMAMIAVCVDISFEVLDRRKLHN